MEFEWKDRAAAVRIVGGIMAEVLAAHGFDGILRLIGDSKSREVEELNDRLIVALASCVKAGELEDVPYDERIAVVCDALQTLELDVKDFDATGWREGIEFASAIRKRDGDHVREVLTRIPIQSAQWIMCQLVLAGFDLSFLNAGDTVPPNCSTTNL